MDTFLKQLASEYPEDHFTHGQCHDLALALYRVHERRGALIAAYYHGNYDHVVYQDEMGVTWDIGGSNAASRWDDFRDSHYTEDLNCMRWSAVSDAELLTIADVNRDTVAEIITKYRAWVATWEPTLTFTQGEEA